jgi:hypothetical protein
LEVLLGAEVQKVLIANANGRGDHKPQAYGVVYYNSDGARKEVQRHRHMYVGQMHWHEKRHAGRHLHMTRREPA